MVVEGFLTAIGAIIVIPMVVIGLLALVAVIIGGISWLFTFPVLALVTSCFPAAHLTFNQVWCVLFLVMFFLGQSGSGSKK